MAIVWDDSLSTGFREIDDQHKELIRSLNSLGETIAQGKGSKEIVEILDFLGNYAERHFGREEACMDRYRCPVAAQNRHAHAEFLETFAGFRERIRLEGATPELVLKIQRELYAWLVNHIRRTDTHLNACVAK